MRILRKTLIEVGAILWLALSLPFAISWAQNKPVEKSAKPMSATITMMPQLTERNDTVALSPRDTELFFDLMVTGVAKSCVFHRHSKSADSVTVIEPTDSARSIVVTRREIFFPTPDTPSMFAAFCYDAGARVIAGKVLVFKISLVETPPDMPLWRFFILDNIVKIRYNTHR